LKGYEAEMLHVHLKIIKIGNSLGIILPKELRMALDVVKGDRLYLVFDKGAVYLTPYDPEFA
jgi:putative addiction module antidote